MSMSSQNEYLTCLEVPDTVQLCLRKVSKVFSQKQGLISGFFGATKSDFVALENINLNIEHNTFVTIIGPSGCGKSTLLNIIAGLSSATTGSVMMNKEPIRDPGPDRGMVFQNYALISILNIILLLRLSVHRDAENLLY
jgi:nitrate/nitrite transport system ATP-binding protein